MPLHGAAIGPDAVLAWTGERELTRFDRSGARTSFELPFVPLDSQIGHQIFAVDERGTTHRFALDGRHEGFVPLLESPGTIREAALSADGSQLAIFTNEVQLFEHGVMRPWSFAHRRIEGCRELGVDLSSDGTCVLVRYATETPHGANLGDDIEAFSITRSDGVLHYRHVASELPPMEIVMSPDARRIAICERAAVVRIDDAITMAPRHRVEGRVRAMHFDGSRLGVLCDYELVLADEAVVRIALPEAFEDFVLAGDEAVCLHPELGAWWITLTTG